MKRNIFMTALICLTGLVCSPLNAEVTANEIDINKDGYKDVVLENGYVKMVFQPAFGGRCTSFYYKPAAKEMISNAESVGGLFTDSTWPGESQGDYCKAQYDYKVRRDKDVVSIELWAMGKTGFLAFVEIRKKITIYDNSSTIKVEYKLTNTPSSMTEFEIGLQICNFLAIEKGARCFFTPTSKGIKKEIYDGKTPKEIWQNNIVDGWSAVIGESKAGLAFVTDYKYLSNFYQWYDHSGFATFEWWYTAQNLPAGSSFDTVYYIVPFMGMERVDKACSWGIVGLDDKAAYTVGKTEEKIIISAKSSQSIELNWKLINLKTHSSIVGGSEKIDLKNEYAADRKIRFDIPENGQFMLDITFVSGKEIIGNMVKMLNVGTADERAISPVCERIGRKYAKAVAVKKTNTEKEYKLREDTVQNAFQWAKPYYGGKLKCLLLTYVYNQREVLELAARFDLNWDTVKLCDYSNDIFYYKYSPGDRSITSREEAMMRLKEKLSKNDYAVIVVAGLRKGIFDKEAMDKIEKQVRNGAGFVLIDIQDAEPKFLEMTGVSDFKSVSGGQWAKTGNHYIVNAIDAWDIYPTSVGDTAFKINGKVLAMEGNYSLLGAGECGKGKVAVFGYKTRKNLSTGLTPVITDHAVTKEGYSKDEYSYGFRGIDFPSYNYWEYYYALLGKALLWAGNKQPETQITGISSDGGKTEIKIQNAGQAGEYIAELTVLDKHSDVECKLEKKVEISKGQAVISISYDINNPGLHLVNIRLLKDARVVDYGTGDFTINTGTSVKKVIAGKDLYNIGDNIDGSVRLNNPSPDMTCRVRLFDYYMLDAYGQTKYYGDIERSMLHGPLTWWTGYWTDNGEAQMWWQLLNSGDQPGRISIYDVSTLFYPDLTPTASAMDMGKWIKEFKSGIGKLRMNIKRNATPIAVHYSMPSVHGAFILDKANYFNANMAAWNRLVKDIGCDLDYVAYKQIEDGDLLKKKYKVLILPYSCAISAKETKAIEDFVRNGGVVIADTSCGVFDEHCKWQKNKGMLDGLLGIISRTDKKPQYVNVDNINAIGMNEGRRILALEDVCVSCEILASNKADFPIASSKTLGNGKAVFLNFDLTEYDNATKQGDVKTIEWYKKLLKNLLKYSGMKDDFPIRCDKPQIRLEKTLYSESGNMYLGLVRLTDPADTYGIEEVTIGLPGTYNVYDVRNKKYIGLTKEIKTSIKNNSAGFFALLPYKSQGIKVTGGDKVQPGNIINFNMSLIADSKNIGKHIFHVDVHDSAGNLLKHYGGNAVAENGMLKYAVPIALNDAPGEWKISAVDVATGAKGEKTFEVINRK